MKKIFYSVFAFSVMFGVTSCMEEDNWDEPEASVRGRIINSVTGENILTDQGDLQINIWERSFSLNVGEQSLNVAADGSYTNTKLFAGTYNMFPKNGPWWNVDPAIHVPIGKSNNATQDFTVTPYLMIKNFKVQLLPNPSTKPGVMDTLRMECKLFCPQREGYMWDVTDFRTDPEPNAAKTLKSLPNVREVRCFLNINKFCGAPNHIGYYDAPNADTQVGLDKKGNPIIVKKKDLDNGPEETRCYTYRKVLNSAWKNIGDMETGEGNETYVLRVPVKRGYRYSVRMGAFVDDMYLKYNYSPIIVVNIPETPGEMQEFTAEKDYPKYYN